MMKIRNIKWLIVWFVIINACFAMSAQNTFDDRIYELEKQVNFTELDSAFQLNYSFSRHYRNTYLRISEEFNSIVKLSQVGYDGSPNFDSDIPPNDGGGEFQKRIIERIIVGQGRIAAWQEELNYLAKATRLGGEELINPHQILPDWQLRSYYQELSKSLIKNSTSNSIYQEALKDIIEDNLSKIETEFKQRGIYAKDFSNPILIENQTKRFQLVEGINLLARLEARQYIDNSPLFIQTRQKIFSFTEQVQELDGILGRNNNQNPIDYSKELLTEQTFRDRFTTLDFGYKKLEIENNVKFGYDDQVLNHKENIKASLNAEREWYYLKKKHAVLASGINLRGPPGDSPFPIDLSVDINPDLGPEGKGNSIGSRINEKQINKSKKVGEKAYQKKIKRLLEKCKALNLEIPRWQIAKLLKTEQIKFYKINSSSDYLQSLAKKYYSELSNRPISSLSVKAEFEVAIKHLFKENITFNSPLELLKENLPLLNEIETEIRNGLRKRIERVERMGDFAEPWRETEIEILKSNVDEISMARKDAMRRFSQRNVSKLKTLGGEFDRPPPDLVEKFKALDKIKIHDFYFNETYQKNILIAQRRALEKARALYGRSSISPSTSMQLNKINSTLLTNDAAKVLAVYKEYASFYNEIKVLIYDKFSPEKSIEMFIATIELENKKAQLCSRINDLNKSAKNVNLSNKVPMKVRNYLRKIGNTLPVQKVTTINTEIEKWRPNQETVLKTLKEMKKAKNPGGIWLSPEGGVFPPIPQIEINWKRVENTEVCPNAENEWFLNPNKNGEGEKICFDLIQSTPNINNTKNIKKWF